MRNRKHLGPKMCCARCAWYMCCASLVPRVVYEPSCYRLPSFSPAVSSTLAAQAFITELSSTNVEIADDGVSNSVTGGQMAWLSEYHSGSLGKKAFMAKVRPFIAEVDRLRYCRGRWFLIIRGHFEQGRPSFKGNPS